MADGTASARLVKELATLKSNPPPGISCYPEDESNMNILTASIAGTPGSPYEKGVFQLRIIVTQRYPFEPPQVRFLTKVYHPNIDVEGRICLDLLKLPPSGSWKPIVTIEGLLTSLQCLLTSPNPDDPLMPEIASQYKYNREQYDKEAEKMTKEHACQNSIYSQSSVTKVADSFTSQDQNESVKRRKMN